MDSLLLQQQTVANGYQCKFSTVVRGVGVIVGGDGDGGDVIGVGYVHCVCFVAGVVKTPTPTQHNTTVGFDMKRTFHAFLDELES